MTAPGPTTASGPEGSPADQASALPPSADVVGSLSPSRASDFLTCPLLYRFRHVDRLPEVVSPDAVRGTVVHKVLELLFDLDAADRTAERSEAMLEPAWEQVVAERPEIAAQFEADGLDHEAWLATCRTVLARYFGLEDPRRLEPAERELYVETVTGSRLLLRGFVDRLDEAPNGMLRVVDYKTGRSPRPGFEAKALFQMKFYALVLWRTRGVVPSVLQLVYLGDGVVVRYEPDEADLLACERKVEAVWEAISEARTSGTWLPRKGPLCAWCSHRSLCPEYGGTPPPLPAADVAPGAVDGPGPVDLPDPVSLPRPPGPEPGRSAPPPPPPA